MEITEYFSCSEKPLRKAQIAAADWQAAVFLASILDDKKKTDKFMGEGCRVYMLTEGEELLAFATLTRKDCIDAPEKYPWIGFVYTYPQHRRKGLSKRLLSCICDKARAIGYSEIWLSTDQRGLYEHYGFTFFETAVEIFDGAESLVYRKEL